MSPVETSAARRAFANRDFRRVWLGAICSSTGTWMQSVTLGAFALKLTGSSTFVGIAAMAALGPFLLLSPLAGVLADSHDRRRIILFSTAEQLVGSAVLAVLAAQDEPHRVGMLLAVLAVGIGSALTNPSWDAMLPSLVAPGDMAGAIAMNSVQVNLTRVVGPVIGGFLYHAFGAAPVFGINALTYAFVIAAFLSIPARPAPPAKDGRGGFARMMEGVGAVRHDPVLRRATLTITGLSLFSLAFISQMPTIGRDNLGIDPKSAAYGFLYGSFGLGTVAGAIAIGTFLSGADLRRLVRRMLAALAGCLLALALVDHVPVAFAVAAVLGFVYFAAVTSLVTIVQGETPETVRGRVLSLFSMGWGGTLPIAGLFGGIVADATSIRWVLLYGAVAAAALSRYARLHREPVA